MSQSKHAPGPWTWNEEGGRDRNMPALVGAENRLVCDFGDSEQYYPSCGIAPDEADARLIASAPDLLAAAELAIRWLSTPDKPVDMFEDIADWFYADTRMLRPGKDDVRGFHTDEERQVAFDVWAKAKGAEIRGALRAAVAKARGQ